MFSQRGRKTSGEIIYHESTDSSNPCPTPAILSMVEIRHKLIASFMFISVPTVKGPFYIPGAAGFQSSTVLWSSLDMSTKLPLLEMGSRFGDPPKSLNKNYIVTVSPVTFLDLGP